MECLYKLETNYSFKEYQKYNWAVSGKKFYIISFIFVYPFLVFGNGILEGYLRIAPAILFPIILVISFFISNAWQKETYESNKLIKGHEITFELYDTYFVQRTTKGEMKVEYCLLQKVIETKTNFYLMAYNKATEKKINGCLTIFKRQGYILSKEQFPEGLENFLRSKSQKLRFDIFK